MTIQNLQQLINQFSTHEQILIRYALKGTKNDGEENKSLRLFEYTVTQKNKISRQSASLKIYQVAADTRINKLITRLFEKILDIIISGNFLEKNERLNDQARLRIGIRKKVLQCATMAHINGLTDLNSMLIASCIKDAEKAESNELLIDLYRLKQSSARFHDKTKEYNFCTHQIDYYQRCYAIAQKILFYYNEMEKHDEYGNVESPEKKRKALEKIIAELGKEKKYMNSVYSRTLFTLFQLEREYLGENYYEAKKLLKTLYDKERDSFMAGGRTPLAARIESELCNCETMLGNYDKAIKHSEKTLSILWTNNKMNYFLSLESLVHLFFYKTDFKRAEEINQKYFSEQNPITNDFVTTKPVYFQACIHFGNKEFNRALKILNKAIPLNKDKTGYDIAIRILRIQCLLALNKQDEASAQIENLRKHISRNQKKTYTSERDKLITRTLVLMQKRGFSGQPKKTESELIKKLSVSTGKYKWVPLTPELIKFHEWYKEYALVKI